MVTSAASIVSIVLLLGILVAVIVFQQLRISMMRRLLDGALHQKVEIGNFLNIFSKNLKSVEEVEDSINLTARYVADLVGASSLCIFIADEEGCLKAAGISGAFPPLHKAPEYILTKPRYILEALRREKIRIGEGIIGEVAQRREAVIIENASEDPRISAVESAVAIETFMAVPMLQEAKLVGVICAVNSRKDGMPFSPEQFSALKFMASQVILAYNIVSVYSTLSRQQRISQELEFAKQLQSSLLPKVYPEKHSLAVSAFYRSAKEVGGDFYDFVEIDSNRLLIVIGDACGKGIPACLMMAMTRSIIRANAERFTNLIDLMRELNSNLYRNTADERFVTVACCLIDYRRNIVEFIRGGHTELLVQVGDRRLRRIYPDGTALGLMSCEDSGIYDTIAFSFLPEMTLMMFTDGITEALNAKEQEFGIDNLCKVFSECCTARMAPHETIEKVLRAIDGFTEGMEQSDDQTLLVFKRQ